MGMLVSTGDSFLQSKPLVSLATGAAETWPTALPTTHVAGGMHTCNEVVSMLLMTVSMHTSTTPAQGRMNPLNVVPCELAVWGVVCPCWVECLSRVAVIHCLA